MIQIDLELETLGKHPGLYFVGMWADDPTWDDLMGEYVVTGEDLFQARVMNMCRHSLYCAKSVGEPTA